MKQIITNKKGTTFERVRKDKVYDTKIWARFKSEKDAILEQIAQSRGISKSTLVRQAVEEYIERTLNGR